MSSSRRRRRSSACSGAAWSGRRRASASREPRCGACKRENARQIVKLSSWERLSPPSLPLLMSIHMLILPPKGQLAARAPADSGTKCYCCNLFRFLLFLSPRGATESVQSTQFAPSLLRSFPQAAPQLSFPFTVSKFRTFPPFPTKRRPPSLVGPQPTAHFQFHIRCALN